MFINTQWKQCKYYIVRIGNSILLCTWLRLLWKRNVIETILLYFSFVILYIHIYCKNGWVSVCTWKIYKKKCINVIEPKKKLIIFFSVARV